VNDIPWFGWIGIAFVLVWGITAVVGSLTWALKRDNPKLAEAIAENTAVNKALLEKLGTIETRLGAVEKTLNDIPQ
jgi:hypothetical protein